MITYVNKSLVITRPFYSHFYNYGNTVKVIDGKNFDPNETRYGPIIMAESGKDSVIHIGSYGILIGILDRALHEYHVYDRAVYALCEPNRIDKFDSAFFPTDVRELNEYITIIFQDDLKYLVNISSKIFKTSVELL